MAKIALQFQLVHENGNIILAGRKRASRHMTKIRNIKDLAEIAGVSTGTVSRALADSPLISVKTRTRIQALAKEHNFRPNVMARNLRIQRTGAIGVVIPLGHETGQHLSDPFFVTMLGLIADALTERGYDLLLSRVIPTDSSWLQRYVDSGRVDGVIVIGQSDQSSVLDQVAARYRPLVAWGAHVPGQVHCSVGSNNRKGGDLAVSHLLAQGAQRIAFLGDPRAIEISERLEGCRDAMARAGLEDMLTVVPAHLMPEAALPDISRFLEASNPRQQGIFAASDLIAMSAMRVLADMGLSVPGDMRVVGYDGLEMGEHTVPRLTTIRQNFTHGAEQLVDMLLRRIAGEETESVVMEPELVVRSSS